MDIQELWEKALRYTEIIRGRLHPLATFSATDLPYIMLSESSVNLGDTAVRQGKVVVEKPSIILPQNLPQFEGFDFQKDFHLKEESVVNFLLVRGVTFPSLKYNNKVYSLDVFEGRLSEAMRHYSDKLQRQENVHTGLIIGPEDCWQFSVLIFVATMVARSAETDIKKLLEEFKKRYGLN
jgi:hypothetical protein